MPTNEVTGVRGGRLLRGVFREDGRGEQDYVLTGQQLPHHLQGGGVNAKIVNKPGILVKTSLDNNGDIYPSSLPVSKVKVYLLADEFSIFPTCFQIVKLLSQ